MNHCKNRLYLSAPATLLSLILFPGIPAAQAQISAAEQALIDRALLFSPADGLRQTNFERADNFRDLGGYPNAAGTHRIRSGLLYRSARLTKIRDRDRRKLQDLGVRRVFDFRSDAERKKRRLRLPEEIEIREYPLPEISEKELRRAVGKASRKSPFDGAKFMEEYYRRLVREFAPVYGAWLRALSEQPPAPQTFQGGVGGQNRVGLAGALLLLTLGVSWEIVQGDYLLSTLQSWRGQEKRMRQIRMYARLRRGLKAEDVFPVLSVRQSYLQAAFDEIDTQYGGFENYLRRGLKISPREQRELQRLYLEPIAPQPASGDSETDQRRDAPRR